MKKRAPAPAVSGLSARADGKKRTKGLRSRGEKPRRASAAVHGCDSSTSTLRLAQPRRRVLCITGDGELMMGIGSLAVVGDQAPANLAILVVFNVDVVGLDRNGTRTTMPLLALGIALLATATAWKRPVRAASDGSRAVA